jgi:hypothetical membrane protein
MDFLLTYVKWLLKGYRFLRCMKASTTSRSISNRSILVGSAIANGYLWLMMVLYLARIDHVLVGVFNELLTIPAFVAAIVFFVLLLIRTIRGQLSGRAYGLALLLLVSSLAYATLLATLK